MSKLIKCSIDVAKIKKEHIFKGEKGMYIDVDVWINDEPDKYGNDAGVKQSYKVGDDWQSHYIGNGKKKSGWDAPEKTNTGTAEKTNTGTDDSSDLPF